MKKSTIILSAKDCSPIENQAGNELAIQFLLSNEELFEVFNFKKEKKNEDKSPLIYFDYTRKCWCAGRYVGEVNFTFDKNKYQLVIRPRFGDIQLFSMIEKIYNIKIPKNKSEVSTSTNYNWLIRRVIAFLWLNLLSKANRHGLPRSNKLNRFKGNKVIGRINVRQSVIPIYSEEQVVSEYWVKTIDQKIFSILLLAHDLLVRKYHLGQIRKSYAAKNALDLLYSSKISTRNFDINEYHKIRYKRIYESFRPVVDLSWDLLNEDDFINKNSNDDGVGFFLDMAEIWEMYLSKILSKHLFNKGWRLTGNEFKTYKSKKYSRKIIPDIIFQKGEQVLVFDAKWKRMTLDFRDFDRKDYFQIHTYINFLNQNSKVVVGGLIYPMSKLSEDNLEVETIHSQSLYEQDQSESKFIVDGINFTNFELESLDKNIKEFLSRIDLAIV